MSSENINHRTGAVTTVARILLIAEAAALALMCLMISSILPMKYLGIIIGVCVLAVALQIIMVAGRGKKGRSIASIVLSVVLCAAAVFVIVFMKNFHDNLDRMSSVSRKKNMTITTQTINVYVRKADGLKLMSELSGKSIGVLQSQDTKNTQLALEQLDELLEKKVVTTGYQGILPLLKGLENSEVDAIMVNSAFSTALTENDTTFLKWAELLGTIDITRDLSEEEADEGESSTKATAVKPVSDVTVQPFLVYLTGMDTRTDEIVADLGNSDVNMVIAVNPATKQMTMVNIPRDYYWYLWGDQNYPDKITHTGYYGVDCSIQTMNSLFGIEINYFVKVGFNSVINIVDAIGGITVNSQYDFDCEGVYFHVGENYLDGYSALQFARERYSLPGGDRARGMNQQEVIRAILSKVTSPEMLPRFNEVLSAVTSNVLTSIPVADMEKILKMTLENNFGWNIESLQVDGTGAWDYCYSLGDANDIMIPDWDTVEAAKARIAAVMNGQ